MAVARVAELLHLARECLAKATNAATRINLSTATFTEKAARFSRNTMKARALESMDEYSHLEHFEGMKAWAAILSFDLRNSSNRAITVGPKATYVTMHVLLPVMLKVIEVAQGTIVGLRGDGAIAGFGIVEITDLKPRITKAEGDSALYAVCDCGDAMVRAVDRVVNPVLKSANVEAGLRIGVGIDIGEIVVTRIGLGEAHELTAYGPPVNSACHRADEGNNEVILTNRAKDAFPEGKDGKTGFGHRGKDAWVLKYPATHVTLE